jgi:hypothetical protein
MKKSDHIYVVWHDAHEVTESWTHIDELDTEPKVVRSIGLLLPNVKKGHICIAQSIIEDENTVDNVLAIPEEMVINVYHVSCDDNFSLP